MMPWVTEIIAVLWCLFVIVGGLALYFRGEAASARSYAKCLRAELDAAEESLFSKDARRAWTSTGLIPIKRAAE